jgi:hypothetical protein
MIGINFLWRWEGCIVVKFDLTLRGLYYIEILILKLGWLSVEQAMQREIWLPK